MNTKLVCASCFAAGIILGVGIGISIGKKIESKETEKKLVELRDFYNRKTKCAENEEMKEEIYKRALSNYGYEETERTDAENEEKPKELYSKLVNEVLDNREKVEKLLAESESPEEDYDEEMSKEDIEMEEWEHKSIWNAEKVDPYEITFQEYEDHPELDKITLLYYTEDGTLTTEDEELIEDVKGTVGNCLDDFATSDERTRFIRNKRLSSDFEVAKVESSYY